MFTLSAKNVESDESYNKKNSLKLGMFLRLVESPTIYLKDFFLNNFYYILKTKNKIKILFSLRESHDKFCSQENYSFQLLRTEQ